MIKRIGIPLFLICIAHIVLSQEVLPTNNFDHALKGKSEGTIVRSGDGSHLSPSGSPFREYYTKLNEILMEGISPIRVIIYQITPSFGNERVVVIEGDVKSFQKEDPQYYLVYHRIQKQSVWSALGNQEELDQLRVVKVRKRITKKSQEAILNLYNKALGSTREPRRIGLDGIGYHFASMQGYSAGDTHSPPKGSLCGELVRVSNELITLAKSHKGKIDFSEEYLQEIEDLTIKFDQSNEAYYNKLREN